MIAPVSNPPVSTLRSPERDGGGGVALARRLPVVLSRLAIHSVIIVGLFECLASGLRGASREEEGMAVERIAAWDFQRKDDRNADRQPDHWRRIRDRQHPAYIESQIVSRDPEFAAKAIEAQATLARLWKAYERGSWPSRYVPEAIPTPLAQVFDRSVLNNCLEVRMDGGAAELISPEIPLDPRYSYALRLEMSCEGLGGHQAWAELHLLDDRLKLLESLPTVKIDGDQAWQFYEGRSHSEAGQGLRWGRVHLKVEPRDLVQISGIARFDSISIYRLPRLEVATNLVRNIASPGDSVEVTCTAMGIDDDDGRVSMELRDVYGTLLQAETRELNPLWHNSPESEAPMFAGRDSESPAPESPHYVATRSKSSEHASSSSATSKAFDGQAKWTLQLETPGLYYVTVKLGKRDESRRNRRLTIVVLPKEPVARPGPFGFSIRDFDEQLTPEMLPDLVTRVGAGWVKFPVWVSSHESEKADRLVRMTNRLQNLNIQCVGRLDQPPREDRQLFGDPTERLYAVAVFNDPEIWQPLLEPVLSRLGLRIEWFQLGADDDLSFVGNRRLPERIDETRHRMAAFSQELKVVMRWRWQDLPPEVDPPPWQALHYTATPSLTADELLAFGEEPQQARAASWVTLNPLAAENYNLLNRVRDLTERMIAIKRAGYSAAFVIDPFDPQHGLFDEKRNASVMLAPWRTLVSSIGSGNYIGSIVMPAGSTNHIFEADGTATMLVWNDAPCNEQLYLGDDVRVTDVWGTPRSLETVTASNGAVEQRIKAGKWPLVIHGLDSDTVRWRQRTQLAVSNLASTWDGNQFLPVNITNTRSEAAEGKLTIFSDTLLQSGRAKRAFQFSPNSTQELEVPISIRGDASAGEHDVRIEFTIDSLPPRRFSVYRQLALGLGDVEFIWDSSRLDDEAIELRVELKNNTSTPVSFDCKLFPAGMPYQRFQMVDAQPGTTSRSFHLRIPDAQAVNRAWIRCEQIGSERILNYRVAL